MKEKQYKKSTLYQNLEKEPPRRLEAKLTEMVQYDWQR